MKLNCSGETDFITRKSYKHRNSIAKPVFLGLYTTSKVLGLIQGKVVVLTPEQTPTSLQTERAALCILRNARCRSTAQPERLAEQDF